MALPSQEIQAAIAANRFGLGAKPGELDLARGDPRGFLTAQIGGTLNQTTEGGAVIRLTFTPAVQLVRTPTAETKALDGALRSRQASKASKPGADTLA